MCISDGNTTYAYRILVRKCLGKKPFVKLRRVLEDIVKINLRIIYRRENFISYSVTLLLNKIKLQYGLCITKYKE